MVEALARVVWPEVVRLAIVVVARVEVPVTTKVLVVVAFVIVTPVNVARDAMRLETKEFVEVLLVEILPVV